MQDGLLAVVQIMSTLLNKNLILWIKFFRICLISQIQNADRKNFIVVVNETASRSIFFD